MTTRLFFRTVMMMAMTAMVSMTFTACGGDDEKDTEVPVTAGDEVTVINPNAQPKSNFAFFVPFHDFSGTSADVYAYMADKGMTADWEDMGYGGGWKSADEKIQVSYVFGPTSMTMVTIEYFWYDRQDYEYILAQTQKVFNVKLERLENTEKNSWMWRGTVQMNGRNVTVNVWGLKNGAYSDMNISLIAG